MKLVACVAAVALTVVGLSASAVATPEEPAVTRTSASSPAAAVKTVPKGRSLDILLSNDDGLGRGGLPALQEALCAAGHRVTVSAPATDQSGSGGSFTGSGSLKVETKGAACEDGRGQTFAVHGTPADSVLFGLFAADEEPDLVVTGINPGQNIAGAMSISGTIGASMISAKEKIPTISVSVELDAADLERNGSTDQTAAATSDAARYTADLVRHLATRHGRHTGLPRGLFLNIAHPVVLDEDGRHDPDLVRGTRLTKAGDYPVLAGIGDYTLSKEEGRTSWYDVGTPGFCRLQLDCPPETVRGADSTALELGFVSVTPLETAFGADKRVALRRVLRGFRG